MKTTKYTHNFFPTGKGLVIIFNNEVTLFYANGDSFNVWSTYENAPVSPDELALLMDRAASMSGQSFSQSGTLSDVLEDMPDPVLAGIYEELVGYDPFLDNPDKSEENRALVAEYLAIPEVLKEVFNYGKES
jgi:hypothetical protein